MTRATDSDSLPHRLDTCGSGGTTNAGKGYVLSRDLLSPDSSSESHECHGQPHLPAEEEGTC
jgi:hypothetical protein